MRPVPKKIPIVQSFDNLSLDEDQSDESLPQKNETINFATATTIEKIKYHHVYNNDEDYISDERRLKYNKKNRFFQIEFLQEYAYSSFRKLAEMIGKGTTRDIPVILYENGISINFSSEGVLEKTSKVNKNSGCNDTIIFDIELRATGIFTYEYDVNSWNNGPHNGYDNYCHGILLRHASFQKEVTNIHKKDGYLIYGQNNRDGTQTIYGANYGSIQHQPREYEYDNYQPPMIEIHDGFEKGMTELSIPILEFKEACSQFIANHKKGGNGIFLITENALRFHEIVDQKIGRLYFRIGSLTPTHSRWYEPEGKDKMYYVSVTNSTIVMLSEAHHCCKSFISFFTREDDFLRISFNITVASSKAIIYIDNRNKE